MKGKMFVISGPSGVGKGTLVAELLKDNQNIALSVSATTRTIRPGEVEGVNYYYKTKEEFEGMIEQNEFLEWASFCDNYYGTPKTEIEKKLNDGKDVILEIEIQGAMQIKKNHNECVFVFILPPSMKVLEDRLAKRGTETKEVIAKRVETAKKELEFAKEYDYLVVNNDLETALSELKGIIASERCRTKRVINDLEVLK